MEKIKGSSLTRRDMIKKTGVLGAGSALVPNHFSIVNLQKTSTRTEEENSKEGTLDWQLQYTGFDAPITMASYPLNRYLRSVVIEGYVSKTSLYPGESIDFMVSTEPANNFLIDIYRLGYYGGKGGRHMQRLGSFKGTPQEVPMMTMERLRECKWDISTTFKIPENWPSGVYLGKLSCDQEFGKQSYVIFVIKEKRKSDLLCQVSDLTWQAYNKWPGNDSLYDDGTPKVWYTGSNVRVSFDRPYSKYVQLVDNVLSTGSGAYLLWEHPMTYWLEKEGYDVTYCSNLDVHFDSNVLNRSKVFLSVGHDEYWTIEMFNNIIKSRDDGLSLAFFSGNSVYARVQLFDNHLGIPGRVYSRAQKTRHDDEKRLMGVSSHAVGYGDWKVKNAGHWIYDGTGLNNEDVISGIIGWEYHGPPFGDMDGLEIVSENVLTNSGHHAGVIYPGLKGNWIFNAGTIWWTEGLSQPPGHVPAGNIQSGRTFGVDSRVQKITSNVLNRMIRDSPR